MPRFTNSKRKEMYYDIDDPRDLDEIHDVGWLPGVNPKSGMVHTTAVQCEVYDGDDFSYGVNKRHRRAIGRDDRFNEADNEVNKGTMKTKRFLYRFGRLSELLEISKD